MSRFRLVPAIIAAATLSLVLRVGDIAGGYQAAYGNAEAQEARGGSEAGTDSTAEGAAEDMISLPEEAGVTDPLMMSRSELDLLQDLAERRQQLDQREAEQAMRERLLAATERRIDEKIVRLESIRGEIDALVRRHEEQENAELASLVKVYENMKPKDAARILERLQMDIQIEVASRMKEAKMAPILAAMSAEAARNLTVQLAERAQLPPVDG